jgi:membrane-anchored protein YejM (alkaline phosphatase superfamily)
MPKIPKSPNQNQKGWASWFGLLVLAAMLVIATRYLALSGLPDNFGAAIYTLTATVGHLGLLAFAPVVMVYLLLRRLPVIGRIARPLTVLLSGVSLTLLVMDTIVFAQHQFHIGILTVALFETSTWAMAVVLVLVFTGLSFMLSTTAARMASERRGYRRALVWLVVISLFAGHFIYAWADARYDGTVTRYARYLPFYYPLTAKRFMAKIGLVDPTVARQSSLMRRSLSSENGELRYPQSAMNCAPASPLPNVLIVILDGMRTDFVNADKMPFVAGLAQDSLRFNQHYSGGNATRSGMFSFLYGLPPTYFDSFYNSQTPAVLMDLFRQTGYDFGIFSAYSLGSPTHLDRTAFAGIPGLVPLPNYPNSGSGSQDISLAATWREFLESRQSDAPLFGYLHFDPPDNNVPPGLELPVGFGDEDLARAEGDFGRHLKIEYTRQYWLADQLTRQVVTDLERHDPNRDTIVIVSGDHGFEFDDSGLGIWEDSSAFTDYQIRTPLLIRWPGRAARDFDHRSSHYDVAPTLLQEIFACTNPTNDYSIGNNLLDGVPWDQLIVSSYSNWAIVTPDTVMISYPGRLYEIRDRNYQPTGRLEIDQAAAQKALAEMSRFYR